MRSRLATTTRATSGIRPAFSSGSNKAECGYAFHGQEGVQSSRLHSLPTMNAGVVTRGKTNVQENWEATLLRNRRLWRIASVGVTRKKKVCAGRRLLGSGAQLHCPAFEFKP